MKKVQAQEALGIVSAKAGEREPIDVHDGPLESVKVRHRRQTSRWMVTRARQAYRPADVVRAPGDHERCRRVMEFPSRPAVERTSGQRSDAERVERVPGENEFEQTLEIACAVHDRCRRHEQDVGVADPSRHLAIPLGSGISKGMCLVDDDEVRAAEGRAPTQRLERLDLDGDAKLGCHLVPLRSKNGRSNDRRPRVSRCQGKGNMGFPQPYGVGDECSTK